MFYNRKLMENKVVVPRPEFQIIPIIACIIVHCFIQQHVDNELLLCLIMFSI